MAGRGRGGYSFGYSQIDVAGGRGGRGGHGGRGAGIPLVAMPPDFYSPDGLEMPPPAKYHQDYVLAGFDSFYTAIKHHAVIREVRMEWNAERTLSRCHLTVDMLDRYRLNVPTSVYAVEDFHQNVGEAQKLGIKEAVLAMNTQTPYWFVDFSYLKLHAMEVGEEVMTYLHNFTRHYACPMDSTYHRRVHVSQSLNYILADAADMIGYDVELERTQRVLMAGGAIWCQVRVRFEGMYKSFFMFGAAYPEQYAGHHSALLYALLHLQDIRDIHIRDVFYKENLSTEHY
ncbi:hypothetical protein ACP4OV_031068 [Aristida adscensionis]